MSEHLACRPFCFVTWTPWLAEWEQILEHVAVHHFCVFTLFLKALIPDYCCIVRPNVRARSLSAILFLSPKIPDWQSESKRDSPPFFKSYLTALIPDYWSIVIPNVIARGLSRHFDYWQILPESPDFWLAEASANPPPRRKMTPQHILVSATKRTFMTVTNYFGWSYWVLITN
jgi:hypothetical protein